MKGFRAHHWIMMGETLNKILCLRYYALLGTCQEGLRKKEMPTGAPENAIAHLAPSTPSLSVLFNGNFSAYLVSRSVSQVLGMF